MLRSRRRPLLAVALIAVTTLGACRDAPTQVDTASSPALNRRSAGTGDFMILGADDTLPADLDAQVAEAGGTVVRNYPELGVAVARATSADFATRAAEITGVESVTEDRLLQLTDPNTTTVAFHGTPRDRTDDPPVGSLADDEPLAFLQWAAAAVDAPKAWAKGYTGKGVRVAILDGGLYDAHPDLAANIDVAKSRSFVPGFAFNEDAGWFWHGTHVAGIVAAGDNGEGVIGIAPNATLIGVKVLHDGLGTFEWMVQGVMYAADPIDEGGAGAQIINMSIGALIWRDPAFRKEIRQLTRVLDRAMRYAHRRGVTIIAATGNNGMNLDEVTDVISVPAQSAHVISVTGTGPIGWGTGNTEFARRASYSNWGLSLVDLAAPGGDYALPGEAPCLGDGLEMIPCWVFDMYLSTSRDGYTWSAGTSMASPVVAGIAALVIERAGGTLPPGRVATALRAGAQDLGAEGPDAEYGKGFVNAYGSIRRAARFDGYDGVAGEQPPPAGILR